MSVSIVVPGSKSHTHRAYVMAARSDRECRVIGALAAADPQATLNALRAWGADVRSDGLLHFQPSALRPARPLDLCNAGTGLRLLMGQAATLPFPTTFIGDDSLSNRPNGELLQALARMGATVGSREGMLPITIQGPLRSGPVRLSGALSSQFTSALLMALPLVPGDSTIALTPPIRSRPYLDVTRTVLRHFGIETTFDGDCIRIPGGQVPRADLYRVPADWSTAAFPLAAAAITGVPVRLEGLDWADPQGDKAIVEHLRAFGAGVRVGATVDVVADGLDSPGTIDVTATPDLFPILAVVAACAKGTTTFTGGATLRHKETDRIAAMAAGLNAMGIKVHERPEGMVVEGGRLRGAKVVAHHDHRIHMAFRVAALVADGETTVTDPECVAISYPEFHRDLRMLEAA